MARLLVINPNSNNSVTQGIRDALGPTESARALEVNCIELADGPFGIESDEDIEAVVPLLVSEIQLQQDAYDAFVIACYSDPGLEECRALTDKPVLGINESAAVVAGSLGRKFGVLALSAQSIQRHIEYVHVLGFQDSHGGEKPLNITVDEAANDPQTLHRIVETGLELINEKNVDSLILGCAGMARHRLKAEQKLGIPVIDPVQAAAKLCIQKLDSGVR